MSLALLALLFLEFATNARQQSVTPDGVPPRSKVNTTLKYYTTYMQHPHKVLKLSFTLQVN